MSAVVPEQVTVRLDWSAAEQDEAKHVNQVLTQVGVPVGNGRPDGICLALGSISPPIIPADPEDRAAKVSELASQVLRVRVAGRYQMSRDVLADLIRVLELAAEQYDAAMALVEGRSGGEQ